MGSWLVGVLVVKIVQLGVWSVVTAGMGLHCPLPGLKPVCSWLCFG